MGRRLRAYGCSTPAQSITLPVMELFTLLGLYMALPFIGFDLVAIQQRVIPHRFFISAQLSRKKYLFSLGHGDISVKLPSSLH